MEAGLLWWRYLDDVYLRIDLILSFVYDSGYEFISTDGTSKWCVIIYIQNWILLGLVVLVIIA